jgi:uncharacterized iron-regulated membrane protein
MRSLIRKIHIYAGLFAFCHLLIYGIAGLTASVQTARERPKNPHTVTYAPFQVQPGMTDQQVADAVYHKLQLPLTRPMPGWFLQRTPQQHLLLDFYNINGIYRVIVLEQEGRLRIEHIRNSAWLFLNDLHAATLNDPDAPPVLRAWGLYNEVAMWSLLGFVISGVYLWVASRPRWGWPWVALGCGAGLFLGIAVLLR